MRSAAACSSSRRTSARRSRTPGGAWPGSRCRPARRRCSTRAPSGRPGRRSGGSCRLPSTTRRRDGHDRQDAASSVGGGVHGCRDASGRRTETVTGPSSRRRRLERRDELEVGRPGEQVEHVDAAGGPPSAARSATSRAPAAGSQLTSTTASGRAAHTAATPPRPRPARAGSATTTVGPCGPRRPDPSLQRSASDVTTDPATPLTRRFTRASAVAERSVRRPRHATTGPCRREQPDTAVEIDEQVGCARPTPPPLRGRPPRAVRRRPDRSGRTSRRPPGAGLHPPARARGRARRSLHRAGRRPSRPREPSRAAARRGRARGRSARPPCRGGPRRRTGPHRRRRRGGRVGEGAVQRGCATGHGPTATTSDPAARRRPSRPSPATAHRIVVR